MASIQLSAVVITYNEEQNIGRCLDSLKEVADEILVVDSFSTDATKAICLEKGVRFVENPFEGHIEQKNFAMRQAKHDYVLSLDADECLTLALQQQISATKANWEHDGYRMNRLTSFCGHWVRHCGWYPDHKLRLWDRRKGQWGGTNPHDTVVMSKDASTAHLKGDLQHYTYHTLTEHVQQMDKFSAIAAREALRKQKKVIPAIHIVFYPMIVFFQKFIFQRGFLDGYYGFLVCINAAYYRYLKYAKLHELYKNTTTKADKL